MKFWLFWLTLVLFHSASGQESGRWPSPLSSIEVKNLDLIAIDSRDQIFISSTTGDIFLYQSTGVQSNLFSPPRQGRLQQLEASWTVNIFSFSADLQSYRILDRFLNPLVEKDFLTYGITLPRAATLGNNNVIWVYDEADLSLKSLNYSKGELIQSQPLNLILSPEQLAVQEIKEYKNRVFLRVKDSGIFLFDNQANFIRSLPVSGNGRLCFYRENLLWIHENSLQIFSLTTQETFTLGPLPQAEIQSIQIGQKVVVLASQDRLWVYPLPEFLKTF